MPIDVSALTDALAAERLAFQIAIAYGNDLADSAEELAELQKSVASSSK